MQTPLQAHWACVVSVCCSGSGFWTRQGCQTAFLEPLEYPANYTYVNCKCSHLSSYAVLMDDPSAEVRDG